MPSKIVKRLPGVAVLVTATLCVASCSGPGHANGQAQNANSPAQVVVEYKAEAKNLTLAPNWTWPVDPTPTKTGPDGHPMVYQPGYGITAADHYWYCSWETYYVSLPPGSAKSKSVYGKLESVRNTEYYKDALAPQDQAYFNQILNQAGSGADNLMQEDVQLNCPKAP